jgi:PTS system mannose-specific IIC component
MTALQAALIALFTFLAWLPSPFLGGQSIAYQGFGKPLVAGLIVGFIMGDPVNGVIIGATINALYIGAITPGGAVSSDLNIAGYVGTALALSLGVSAEESVALAVPLGLIGTFAWQIFAMVNSFLTHKTDEIAAKGDVRGMTMMAIWVPSIIAFVIRFVPTFLILFFGSQATASVTEYVPDWLTHVMTVVGGILPAIGMAVLLKMLITNPVQIGFFVVGFILVSAMGLPIFTVALLAMSAAMVSVLFKMNGDPDEVATATAASLDGGSDDMDDLNDLGSL